MFYATVIKPLFPREAFFRLFFQMGEQFTGVSPHFYLVFRCEK
ncbi:hypothetical protein C2W59_02464 [Bacillus pumilus]|nr:hypothetical protein C2W59_02464 [Bacillus pumilus]